MFNAGRFALAVNQFEVTVPVYPEFEGAGGEEDEVLGHSPVRSLALLPHSLAPHCALASLARSAALIRSLVR